MADFIKYGTARGLGKSINYQSIINQRMQNEQMLRQVKDRAVQRAKEEAARMSPYNAETEWIAEEYDNEINGIREELKTLKKKNPNYMYSVEGQMEFNKIANKTIDNKWVRMEETSKKNYENLMQNMSKLSDRAALREIEKYRQYKEGEVKKPYIFDPTSPYDINEMIMEGSKNLETFITYSNNFETIEDVDDNSLALVAQNTYTNNKLNWDDAWDDYKFKDMYNGNRIKWIAASIKATKQRAKYKDWSAENAKGRLSIARDRRDDLRRNWWESNVANTDLEHATVNKGWLFATDADITNAEQGGYLNDPSDIYYLDQEGNPVKLKNNFSRIKLVSATDAMALPNAGPSDPNNEFLKVTAEIDWNTDKLDKESFLEQLGIGPAPTIPGEGSPKDSPEYKAWEARKNQVISNYRRTLENLKLTTNDKERVAATELLIQYMKNEMEGELSEDQKSKLKKFLESNSYTGTFWVPMHRERVSSAVNYNKWFGSQKNARETDILGGYGAVPGESIGFEIPQ